jgi:hypothetical protein
VATFVLGRRFIESYDRGWASVLESPCPAVRIPNKRFVPFYVRGKLTPWFTRPFKILEKRGEVTYQLELPPQLLDVHDLFHVSQLKKCLRVPEEQIPMEDLYAEEDLLI